MNTIWRGALGFLLPLVGMMGQLWAAVDLWDVGWGLPVWLGFVALMVTGIQLALRQEIIDMANGRVGRWGSYLVKIREKDLEKATKLRQRADRLAP